MLAGGLLFAAAPAAAQFGPAPGPCIRSELQMLADKYIEAQTKGEPLTIPFDREWINYNEQFDIAGMGNGIISKPQKIDFYRHLLDTRTCQAFTEVVIADPAHPYVLGNLLTTGGGRARGLDTLITDKGDWLFDAAGTLKYSKAENWGEIPEGQRDSRETIMAAANAYLDRFNDEKVQVPWGSPCQRLEGGMYTGKGAPGTSTPQDSCDVGVPTGVKIVNRRYVVDETLGAVAVLSNFGNNQLPDAHIFRVEGGKIRYVHTITVCKTDNCGFTPGAPGQPPQPPATATK